MANTEFFHESNPLTIPIRDMGLTIAGTWLDPVLRDFEKEVQDAGIHRPKPRFYLSNDKATPERQQGVNARHGR